MLSANFLDVDLGLVLAGISLAVGTPSGDDDEVLVEFVFKEVELEATEIQFHEIVLKEHCYIHLLDNLMFLEEIISCFLKKFRFLIVYFPVT